MSDGMNERACDCVGIDLGTTYSSLAYLDSQKTPRVVCDSSGQAVMPSVVFFDDDEIIVGDMALSQARLRADRVVQFIKVHMGDEWRREFNGKVHTPESISALILSQLVREAEPEIGRIRNAVITVPAYFTEKRRRATQQAGEIAHLNVLGTLNEPMSAALAYGLHRTPKEQFAVVYDLGGGTFDVTIVRITPNELEEMATNGNRQLGGKDWDQALMDHVCEDFQKATGVDPRQDIQAIQDLQLDCERAKRRLGRMAKSALRLHACGQDHTTEVTREAFESMTAHLVQATQITTEIALEDAGLAWDRVSRIVLVGGSTHLPSVRQMLKQSSGITPDTGVNPVVAVALGAATYGLMLETGQHMKTIHQKPQPDLEPVLPQSDAADDLDFADETRLLSPDNTSSEGDSQLLPEVRFVTAHGVGLKTKRDNAWRNVVLIPKNSQVPKKITKRFRTAGRGTHTGQLSIKITQGDAADVALVEELGTGVIKLPPQEVTGKPVDVTMEFDEQGRLHACAVYVDTGKTMNMTVDVQGCLKEEEIEAYREYMQEVGFVQPFDSETAIARLCEEEDDDDDIPTLESI